MQLNNSAVNSISRNYVSLGLYVSCVNKKTWQSLKKASKMQCVGLVALVVGPVAQW